MIFKITTRRCKEMTRSILFIFYLLVTLFMTSNLSFANTQYFVLPYPQGGPFSINPLSGNIAVPFPNENKLIIFYSSDFQEKYRVSLDASPFSSTYSFNSALVFCGIDIPDAQPPVEEGKIAFIDNINQNLIGYTTLDVFPQILQTSNNNQYIYTVGGMKRYTPSKVYKINTSTRLIEEDNDCGNGSAGFSLNHDDSKIYVIDGQFYATPTYIDDDLMQNGPPYFSKIWIFRTLDLENIGSINVDCGSLDIVPGPSGQMVVSHIKPLTQSPSRNSSLTIINSLTDTVDREIEFQDTGFGTITYDNFRNQLLGSVTHHIGEKMVLGSEVAFVDLSNDTMILVQVSDEEVEYIVLSPDGSRLYAQNGNSNRIYYVDL